MNRRSGHRAEVKVEEDFVLYRSTPQSLSPRSNMRQDASPPSSLLEPLNHFAFESGADGVTVWMAESGQLTAVCNPLEPEVVGLRQSLDSGLISQAYLTGQAILSEDLASEPAHDPSVDHRLGKRCRSMVAAPFEGGEAGGVVSAVMLESSPRAFTFADLGKVVALAREIGERIREGKCQ